MLKDAEGMGLRIRVARVSRNVSQRQLADMVGKSLSTVSMYETGKRTPRVDTLKRIAEALDVSAAGLAGFDEEEG